MVGRKKAYGLLVFNWCVVGVWWVFGWYLAGGWRVFWGMGYGKYMQKISLKNKINYIFCSNYLSISDICSNFAADFENAALAHR